MRPENAIEVKNIKKQFRIYKDKGSSLKEKVLFRERNKYETRTVLKGISFQIKKGEAVGLIGHNGCGKSTTLKLLTKIMYPDSGKIEIAGRVSSLLELGAGFHPDMSGRDNIFINASIFGLTRKEIEKRIEDIIEFSELGDYIDNPIRTYSSGMYMRLAFSVAINVNADVLLVDEILAVGDANYQSKCLEKMRQIKEQGTTIVIVSHTLSQIESFCDRSIWLNDGVIAAEGNPYSVHSKYLQFMEGYQFQESAAIDAPEASEGAEVEETETIKEDTIESPDTAEIEEQKDMVLEKVSILDQKGEETDVFQIGQTIKLVIQYKINRPFEGNIQLVLVRKDGVRCFASCYTHECLGVLHFENDGEYCIIFPNIQLVANVYKMNVMIEDKDSNEVCSYSTPEFRVEDDVHKSGVFRMEHIWQN